MSSLQKFHRRTNSGPVTWPPTAVGGGDATRGFWAGGPAFNALIVAPISTETSLPWGSSGTVRNTTSTTNGLANTNTLYSFGSAAHPAPYYCKTLTTGGYTTWYLPALDELITAFSNKNTTPFSPTNTFRPDAYWTSTEVSATNFWYLSGSGVPGSTLKTFGNYSFRAIRRYAVPTATIGSGDSTNGYWLGTAGDGVSKLVVAPKSTEVQRAWGSSGTVRGTTSTTNGVANSTTLFGFGSAAHPAAYYAKSLTTGGYNTWYLPAVNEMNTLYSNKSALPFATDNSFLFEAFYWSSTERNGSYAELFKPSNGGGGYDQKNRGQYYVRAVRRV